MGLPKPHQQTLGADIDGGADVTRSTSKVLVGLLSVIAVILGAGALKASAVVTMPLALAFFVAILVHPIERSLAAHLPAKLEWLGVACAMLAVVGALALAVALLSFTLAPVLERAPQYADDLYRQWESAALVGQRPGPGAAARVSARRTCSAAAACSRWSRVSLPRGRSWRSCCSCSSSRC